MSNLPPNPYDRTKILEPTLDNPDRAAVQGTGKDFVVTFTDTVETPGAEDQVLSRTGKWVTVGTAALTPWGGIVGDIEDQADLMAMFDTKANISDLHPVAFSGNYNALINKPPLGTVSPINLNGDSSQVLHGDGFWRFPTDVGATWGNIAGDINAQADLMALLGAKSPINSPTFTGTPRAPNPAVDDNSDRIATTGWFFGQAFNGLPIMDGVASSGDSTRWARGNHRHPGDTTKVDEAPNDGQQYARQSLAWTTVTGGSGGSGGKVFYFAYSDASDIATYKTLLLSPSTGVEQVVNTSCTGTSDFLIAAFITDPGIPGVVDYRLGTAFRNIYAKVNAGTGRLHLQVYIRNAAGVETLVRDEFSNNILDQTVALQSWTAAAVAAGILQATDRLVAKLYAQRVTGGSGTVIVTTYFEGTSHASYLESTIPASTGSIVSFTNSETEPSTKQLGDRWYVPSTARLYTWVFDGTSSQWAELPGLPALVYDLGGGCTGAPTASLVLMRYPFPRVATFPAGLTNSKGVAATAATAQTDFNLLKNGVSFGTMRFAAAGTVATFIAASATSFALGDVLTVSAPGTPDSTLANIGFTLAGTR